MKRRLLLLLVFPLLLRAGAPDIAADLRRARAETGVWPLASARGVGGLPEAYAVQRELVAATVGGAIGGFKAGLTTPALRQRFQAEEPVFAVLPAAGRVAEDGTIDRAAFRTAKLEMEIAFILGAPVTGRVADVAALKSLVTALAPAVEVPDLAFADPAKVTAVDLVATNVGQGRWIIGQEIPVAEVDLTTVRPVLRRGDTDVARGALEDAMGDPWASALWIVNHAVEQGYFPTRGQVLFTGALGGLSPAEPGRHVADFGSLGVVRFGVK